MSGNKLSKLGLLSAIFLGAVAAWAIPSFANEEAAVSRPSETLANRTVQLDASNSPAVSEKDTAASKAPLPDAAAPAGQSMLVPQPENGNRTATSLPDPCLKRTDTFVQGYNRDIAREKSDLDSSITFPLSGSSIITSYILDYNKEVTRIFNKYTATAAKANCPFPVQAAPVLPETYLPAGL